MACVSCQLEKTTDHLILAIEDLGWRLEDSNVYIDSRDVSSAEEVTGYAYEVTVSNFSLDGLSLFFAADPFEFHECRGADFEYVYSRVKAALKRVREECVSEENHYRYLQQELMYL